MNRIKDFFLHSGRLLTVIVLLVITFSYAMYQGGFVSWFIFFTILPFSLYSIVLAFIPIRFQEVSRTLSKEYMERGDNVFVTVTFRNTCWVPLIFLTVNEIKMDENYFEAPNGQINKLFLVGWKRQFEWTYELKHLQRGEHHFKGIEFMCTDFFGWTIRKVSVEKPQLFFVYPKVHQVDSIPLQMQYEQGAATSLYSLIKDTTMVTGVREYVPGDRFSWIHWKSFAKNGELRTKDFEDRQSQNTFIIMDRAVQKNFEQVVDYTASFIQKIMKERGEVSLLSVGTDRYFAPVIKTENQLNQVMQHFVTVQPDAQFGVARLLYEEQKMMNRSLIVIVTGELTSDLLDTLNSGVGIMNKVLCFVVSQQTEKTRILGKSQIHYVPMQWFQYESEVRQ
jgi:uncharacterized protein (DUF58 family)